MEHGLQYKISTPSHSAPDSTEFGVLATREQLFNEDIETPTKFILYPFGSTCYVVIQYSKRVNAMTDTAERCLYLFAGVYNPFSHAYANSPQSCVVLRENNRLMITARVVFPHLRRGGKENVPPTESEAEESSSNAA